MSKISDEKLMAYADGELGAEDRRGVEQQLKNQPEDAARLQAFVATGRELARLFEQPMLEPVPQRILDTVFNAPVAQATAPATKQPLPKRHAYLQTWLDTLFPARSPLHTAAAFAIVLACGSALGWMLHANQRLPSVSLIEIAQGQMLATVEFRRVLETTTSGTPVIVSAGASRQQIKPVLTFANIDGGYCRQYDLELAVASRFEGVACRTPAGQWHIEVHAQSKPAAKAAGSVGTASGPSGAALDAAFSRMSKGDALGAVDEQRLITRSWQVD